MSREDAGLGRSQRAHNIDGHLCWLPEMLHGLYNPAVVAASYRTSVRNSHDHLLAVPNH